MKKIIDVPNDGDDRVIRKFVLCKTLPPLLDIKLTNNNGKQVIKLVKRKFETTLINQKYDGQREKWIDYCWADLNLSKIIGQ